MLEKEDALKETWNLALEEMKMKILKSENLLPLEVDL